MVVGVSEVTSGLVRETVQIGPLDSSLPQGDRLTLSPVALRSLERYEPGSPGWWLSRLMRKLEARSDRMREWDDYYRGRQPLAFASEKFREAFGGRFRAFSTNFTSLIVDATRERMEVQGFRLRNARSARRAWSIWQDNQMDASSLMVHTEAIVKSVAYALVEPRRLGSPRITVEDPLGAIVEVDPRDPRIRLAGLKCWQMDGGDAVVYLYLPDYVWKFTMREGGTLAPLMVGDEPWPLPNPLGAVPLVPLPYRPRVDGSAESEIEPVKSIQDAINKYQCDALIAAEFGAFRQRWAIGIDIPVDKDTGKAVEPFKAAVDRLWYMPGRDVDDPRTEPRGFGEFDQTDLEPYKMMIEQLIGSMSTISRVPYHYLLGQPQSVPPSGESLKSSEAGLIRKVTTACVHFGEGWEETIRLALRAAGDPAGLDVTIETDWADPETRNEAVRTDSVIKQFQVGLIDRPTALAELGYSPEQVMAMTTAPPTPETPDAEVMAG